MVHAHTVAFPAILDDTQNAPGTYTVTFPDVPGAISQGVGIPEALANGAEALAFMLYDEKKLPTASDLSEIKAANPEAIVSYIVVDLSEANKKVELESQLLLLAQTNPKPTHSAKTPTMN